MLIKLVYVTNLVTELYNTMNGVPMGVSPFRTGKPYLNYDGVMGCVIARLNPWARRCRLHHRDCIQW